MNFFSPRNRGVKREAKKFCSYLLVVCYHPASGSKQARERAKRESENFGDYTIFRVYDRVTARIACKPFCFSSPPAFSYTAINININILIIRMTKQFFALD